MLTAPTHVPIYLCTRAVDLRKSFDGLCGVVEAAFGKNLLEGGLFLFVNRRRDRLKALWWEPGGLVIWYKRLEQGTLELPQADATQPYVTIDATQLAMWLGGVSLAHARQRRRRMQVA